jgi:hypothetical protein
MVPIRPFVQFDEERTGSAELTTPVSSIRLRPLRLLYGPFPSGKISYKPVG